MNPTSKKFKSINSGRPNSVNVDGDLNYALKAWKKIVKDANIMQECYDRKFYRKPSERNRLQMQLAVYVQTKETIKDADQNGIS